MHLHGLHGFKCKKTKTRPAQDPLAHSGHCHVKSRKTAVGLDSFPKWFQHIYFTMYSGWPDQRSSFTISQCMFLVIHYLNSNALLLYMAWEYKLPFLRAVENSKKTFLEKLDLSANSSLCYSEYFWGQPQQIFLGTNQNPNKTSIKW